jgi:cellulase/cellobiase CelA1
VDAGAQEPAADYELKQTVNNDWGAGYCHTYEIINRSAAPLAWSVSFDLGGTLNQNWESKVSGSTGTVQFTGVEHNALLSPGASAQFGYCVTR